ncbi:MAG: MarR family transcriptional regulator [Chloroflexota bacterium]
MKSKDTPQYFHSEERRAQWRTLIQELSPDTNPLAIRLMEQMRLVWHSLYLIGEQSLSEAGLSYAQYRLLLTLFYAEELDGRSELNPSEISKMQGTSRNTISGLIRNLENEQLIERHLDKQDRRKFNICLTESGRALVIEHSRKHTQIIDACFNTLTQEEQNTFDKLLVKLGKNAKKGMEQCK